MKRARWLVVLALVLAVALLPFAAQAAVPAEGDSNPPVVKFDGVVEGRPEGTNLGTWTIAGQAVEVVEATRLVEVTGAAEVGAVVTVIANRLEDGSLEAILIRVHPPATPFTVRVRGQLTYMGPDHLVVNGLTIRWTAQTRFEGQVMQGAYVMVEAAQTQAGLVAMRVVGEPDKEHRRIVEFGGTIESIVDDLWTVGGVEVTVGEYTVIEGTPQVGDEVVVRALEQADGSLLAVEIKIPGDPDGPPQLTNFTGIIEHFPPRLWGSWMIGGQSVLVTSETVIVGAPRVGLPAAVEGRRVATGALVANRITIIEPAAETVTVSGRIWRFPPDLLGQWVIDRQTVMVTSATQITGTPQVGRQATVEALRFSSGLLIAVSVEIDETEPPATPQPSRTPPATPEPSRTPPASRTPGPSRTPSATPHHGSGPAR